MNTLSAHNSARMLAQTLLMAHDRDQMTVDTIAAAVDQVSVLVAARGPVDRESLIRELESMYSVWIGSANILESGEGHIPWLAEAKKKLSWGYWERYRLYLANEHRWAPAALAELERTTDEALARLEDPTRDGFWDRRGLVVGHVQSGKTSNYTGLICKAADAGYKIIIVLTGIHNSLRSQTQLRLDAGFVGFDSKTTDSKRAGQATGVGLIDPSSALRPIPLTTSGEVGDFRRDYAKRTFMQPDERPILLVLKKNGSVLQNVLNWIGDTLGPVQVGDRRVVTRWPVLVVDDEADHASVDTREQTFDDEGTPDPDHDPTRINKLIRRILHSFQRAAYVGYTATPFANIFIHEQGRTLECGDDLFPRSFIISLTAPSNYVGPVRVFGLGDGDSGRVSGLGVTRNVDDFVDEVDAPTPVGWMPNGHKRDHVPRYKGANQVPPSLQHAIRSFAITCAARRARGQVRVHNSMLVHVTRFTDVQRHVHEQVEEEVKSLVRRLRFGDGDAPDQLLAELKKQWEEDFVPTSTASTFDGEDLPAVSWEQVCSQLLDATLAIRTKLINGRAEDVLDYEEHKHGISVIAIGGDKLSRGLTLEGLSVSYYLRATAMYDTLMQMGRWFGYRPGYIDLCRLYLPAELQSWFEHVTTANEELRDEFDRMARLSQTPQAYGLRVQSHPSLMVTSRVKMRSGVDLDISFAGDIVETTVLETGERNLENIRRTAQFLSGIPVRLNEDHKQPRPGGKAHSWKDSYVWTGVPGELVADYLSSLFTHPGALKVNGRLLADFVRLQMLGGELRTWTVALLSQRADEGGPPPLQIGSFAVRCWERDIFSGVADRLSDRFVIRRLLSPRDEALDLGSDEWARALEATRARIGVDGGRDRSPESVAKIASPSGLELRQERPAGAGLLLLYPLDPGYALKSKQASDALKANLDRAVPVLGFGISFPASTSTRNVRYRVNNVYAEATLR